MQLSVMGKPSGKFEIVLAVPEKRTICDEEINLLLSILPQDVLDQIDKTGGAE